MASFRQYKKPTFPTTLEDIERAFWCWQDHLRSNPLTGQTLRKAKDAFEKFYISGWRGSARKSGNTAIRHEISFQLWQGIEDTSGVGNVLLCVLVYGTTGCEYTPAALRRTLPEELKKRIRPWPETERLGRDLKHRIQTASCFDPRDHLGLDTNSSHLADVVCQVPLHNHP